MNTFLLSFNATTTFSGGNAPTLEVLVGGVVVSSITMQSGASSYDLFIEYSGDYPSSLSLRFDGSSGDPGDTISFTAVSINDTALNLVTDLTATLLAQAQSSAVSAANDLYGHTTPTLGATTISGTGGDDPGITSSNAADTIDAMAGNDWVFGRGGNDEINGGAGADFLFGEDGNDTVLGGAGDDFIMGNDGDDILFGEGDNDFLIGGDGSDLINGGAGADSMTGDAGDDVIFGEDGDDWMTGDAGDDILFGDNGNDFLLGGIGNDSLAGGDGDDQLIGDTGDDLLSGGDGADEIVAGTGADVVSGGAGDDNIYGDDGNDELAGGDDNDYITGGDGADTLNGDAGIDVLIGGDGADTLNGGAGADILHGHGLDAEEISTILDANPNVVYSEDTGSFYEFVNANVNYAAAIAAATGSTLNGLAGHLVTITTDAENTYVSGLMNDNSWTSGQDVAQDGTWQWNAGPESGIQFSNSSGTATNNMYESWDTGQPQTNTEYNTILYTTGVWHDWVDTSTHSYVIEWESGLMGDDGAVDTINGDAGNDWIYGYDGNDILDGGADNDVVFGGADDDTIDGDSGADVLYGGTDDDTINGGAGNDILYADTVLTTTVNSVTLLSEAFGTDTGVFTYSDGGFGGSDPANVDVTGSRDTGDGNTAAGSLEVYVDGQNNSAFSNGSGSWDASIHTTNTLTNVQISFAYRHWQASQNDNNEDSQVWFEFDGTAYDGSGGNSFISEHQGAGGGGPADDTGWVTVTIDLPDLSAGTTYDLSMGIIHLGSNRNNEDAYVRFDDITITGDENLGTVNDVGSTNILNGGDNDDTLYGSSGTDTLNGDAGDDTVNSNSTVSAAISTILGSDSNAILTTSGEIFHFYTSSTTFVAPTGVTSVDYLVVGGGGGGGGIQSGNVGGGGGGGAGEVDTATGYSVTAGNSYTVTIGTGGTGGVGGSSQGGTGGTSAFDGNTAVGGGGGASNGVSNNGNSGASGGGGRLTGNGATGTDGNNGGNGSGSTTATAAAGGGGGAGSNGANGSGNNGGDGGDGVTSSITGVSTYYGGGGGGGGYDGSGNGGDGGLGGGGDAPDSRGTGGDAVDSFGGGGAGAAGSNGTGAFAGGDGGDGVVVVSYSVTGPDITTLAGGTGNDDLYGSSGLDIFEFSDTGSANDDTIYNFNRQMDKIDLSDLLTGYDAVNELITDYVQITTSGSDSIVRVDTTGSGTFSGTTRDVATINNVTGLTDELILEATGVIIV